ncbi:endonuclease/exonuclease/phosphatase family protein [Pyxidicoccus parkwayensis]|uniref:Endonuclease/exonuclease/phosphatase family protein n=1 Tax=Pyxidicoccus parkwayensis TaxID=2813578 RepID=A0ABX7NPL0_9BACT|nr:MIR domain-containing protein [Pyxidicoccus parkwaysis]QSQ20792.1 endonuclease/exonuclease/phosphatase family protein [Pyxidicoccus parkwaysis]
MAVVLRVMCWNIAEGSMTGKFDANSMIPRLAEEIRVQAPDIVLLNEVRNENPSPLGNGVNQMIRLSELTGIPYRHWANTNALGLSGHKVVGILSRFPLGSATYHPVMMGSDTTGFGTLESSVDVDGMNIQIFSTRFNPVHYKNDAPIPQELAENIQGHHQFADMMRNRNPSIPVIFGGDFNAWPQAELHKPQYDYFMQNSTLTNTLPPYPEVHPQDLAPEQPDFIYYRGPFSVRMVTRRDPENNPTDHPFVLAELQSPPQGFTITYGTAAKLRHCNSGRALHSHLFNYGHPGSSGQQQVTAYEGFDENDWWRIRGPHGTDNSYRRGTPVYHGDIVRLVHRDTRRNLHSHSGHPSPVSNQQEVTCFGAETVGDGNDNWRVEVEGGGAWTGGKRVRLIHVGTNYALHSHHGFKHPDWTRNQQEVTCYNGRDENDWWSVFTAYALDGKDPL